MSRRTDQRRKSEPPFAHMIEGMAEESDVPAETRARRIIDGQLEAAGWNVCDRKDIDFFGHQGNAVREVIMADGQGRADYLLYVDKKVVGAIEAKPEGTPLLGVEWQSGMYAAGLPEAHRQRAILTDDRLPFIFEASGSETRFTNGFDPLPRSRKIFSFPKPDALARIVRNSQEDPVAPTWRAKVRQMPELVQQGMRPAQIEAIHGIEQSLAKQQFSRSLVQMATGAGKTFTAVTECYRLLKFGGFQRVLFLVDRNNLADQTMREFRDYTTPDDGRKFTELYNVDKLTAAGMIGSSSVVVSTIQRVYAGLRGQPIPDADDPAFDSDVGRPDIPVEVEYSAEMPPEAFDLIIVDECHRSIYGVWRGILDYFDAQIVGLTATPGKQTFGFFQQNLVSEYTYSQSVVDGVNVDFDVYRIKTQITADGSNVEAGTIVPKRDRKTRRERYEALDEDMSYTSGELDRAVTSKSQIRLVLETFRDRLFTEIFPGRSSVPKTLIFAKDDNHAEEILTTAREVFGEGNDFAAKITYSARDPKQLLAAFRTSPTLRIAVTVDMIATGTDVKPLECVFFMRDVRSAGYFEQMKGRGARTIDSATFKSVTPDADQKTRFVIIDAVGVTEHPYIDAVPLQRDRAISLQKLLEKAANLTMTVDEVATLASRLARLERQLTPAERSELEQVAGQSLSSLGSQLISAVDPDRQAGAIEAAPVLADGTPNEAVAISDLVEAAIEPIASNLPLRQRLLEIRQTHDLVIDEVSRDTLLEAAGVVDAERAQEIVTSWRRYLEDNKDEITALEVLFSTKVHPRVSYQELAELADRIQRPPRQWTVDTIWNAYAALDGDKVHQSNKHTATDLVALVRYTVGFEGELIPYADAVNERYESWLAQQEQAGVRFDDRERWWLDRIADVIAQSAGVSLDDLDAAPFTERGGIDGASRDLGSQAGDLLIDLNEALTA